jgi:glycosyltransferase involved in cell wall biosynthesis
LPGFVDNPFAYLRKSAVFVLSSESEGLPSVLIEALSVGTPVVSTDCPCGPSEILENGRYGSLVPVGDINALAQSIISTLDNPCDSRILLQRAQQYSLETVTEQYLSLALG